MVRGRARGVGAVSEGPRQELLQDNIRVTLIEPGAVETELPNHITDEDARGPRRPAVPGAQAGDIASAIVYAVTQPARVGGNEILIRPTR